MAIVHIVLFEFKPTCELSVIQDVSHYLLGVCKRMLALKDACIHPSTRKPYIKTSVGGRDNSPEGHQGGFSHGFVSHFESEEDRKYYLEQDPAHLGFVKSLAEVIQNVRVVDFTAGVF